MIITSQDSLITTLCTLKSVAQKGPYPSMEQRLNMLMHLEDALLQHEAPLLNALQIDFGHRAHEESRLLE
ncbi:coniferyl-aldehyde dehydrogenase, partial [Marinomonas sp.]|nr:coniferyl-aldehyde dehydrogenase [Marinomonas sp.]